MKVHLLTAVTRPSNLAKMAQTISLGTPGGVEVVWHLKFDPQRKSEAGQSLKNEMLDGITDGWVTILDDDNLLHPRLLSELVKVDALGANALVVAQRLTEQHSREAPRIVRVGKIDAAQAVIAREFIGDRRLPESYEGDGLWLQEILLGAGGVVYCDEVLSYYNALR